MGGLHLKKVQSGFFICFSCDSLLKGVPLILLSLRFILSSRRNIVVSLIDMGGRLRLICQDIICVKPIMPMPNLPVARVMWKAMPNLNEGLECWITAGGAHHTVLSYDADAEMLRDFARIMDIEFVHINKDTTPVSLENELFLNDLARKLK